jgi:hypothetical protein
MNHVIIQLQLEDIGAVAFNQPEKALQGMRTASGIRIHLPTSISFRSPQRDPRPLILENLKATLTAGGFEIGVARSCESIRSRVENRQATLTLDLTLEALAFYESIRAGGEPQFSVMLSGHIQAVLQDVHSQPWEAGSVAMPITAQGFVKYSRDAWTNMLRESKVHDTVLVEIPFDSDPPSGWESVWHALRDARDSFDRGGSTGWKNCIASVRHALENWQGIEKVDQGAGWQRPSTAELQSRTKEQRIDNIRWHLIQLAHYAAHTRADDWTMRY